MQIHSYEKEINRNYVLDSQYFNTIRGKLESHIYPTLPGQVAVPEKLESGGCDFACVCKPCNTHSRLSFLFCSNN